MIAIAVFVGSMGEYYLEHRIMQERRDEGLKLLLRNLENDRLNIKNIIRYCDRGLVYLSRSKMMACRYRNEEISRGEFLRQLADDLPNFYSYRTLFMDRAAFNSMSAAGLISLVSSAELKAALSDYYEYFPIQNTAKAPGATINGRPTEKNRCRFLFESADDFRASNVRSLYH